MYHSITFWGNCKVTPSEARWLNSPNISAGSNRFINVNTWDDWKLIPSSRPTIAQPTITTDYKELDGLEGTADYTEYIPGTIILNDRVGAFSFYVANNYNVDNYDNYNWIHVYEQIVYNIHGKKLSMSFEDDPSHYYVGKFTLNSFKPGASNSMVEIGYELEPGSYDRPVPNTI